MSLFDSIFKKTQQEKQFKTWFSTFDAYTPAFSSYEGGVYEMALTRAAINVFATHCGKLKPEVVGSAAKDLKQILEYQPNPYQDTFKFLYRLATIYKVHNTAFIAPLLADDMETVTGFYPLLPTQSEIVDSGGVPWLRYTFSDGRRGSIELSKAGILTGFQYKSDFFGESNRALDTTMQLINAQNQAIINGAKNSAAVRFLARMGTIVKPEDIDKERERFVKSNLSAENTGGVMIADAKFADIKQIESKPYLVGTAQMQAIKENIFDYFGVNDDILHNAYVPDKWAAYYEGAIEPFALQLGLVMTNMTFTKNEKKHKNQIFFSSNRLQIETTAAKLSYVTQMFDRGMCTPNQGAEVFNMPVRMTANGERDPLGDAYYIRKEYAEVNKLDADVETPTPTEPTPTEGEQTDATETE